MKDRDIVCKNFDKMIHGGDYNPDQWLHEPGIVDEDFRLLKVANMNSVTVGIFSWSALEPEEGRFEFGWLDDIMDRCAAAGMGVILATPSGAKPAWMAKKYPELMRMIVPDDGWNTEPVKQLHHRRHNFCPSSEVYREKCRIINTKLAERYKNHPALIMWHVSNEYSPLPYCKCPKCMAKFREWVKNRYGTIEELNKAWWTGFWSKTINDWDEIIAIDPFVSTMALDYKRFSSDNMVDFFRTESAPLREITPEIPITVNMMGNPYYHFDYWKIAPYIDVASWDAYPQYHGANCDQIAVAREFSFSHDIFRSLKNGRPFLMMESCPGPVQWFHINRQLRPGIHKLKSLQAIAHGSDSVCYFQVRKGRGGPEQFHGAVIDHCGNEDNRMFQEVSALGKELEKLNDVVGCHTKAEVAIVMDWDSWWYCDASMWLSRYAKDYMRQLHYHYNYFWQNGIPVDAISQESDLSKYKLVIAPRLFMLKKSFADNVRKFVSEGGSFVTTFLSCVVDESGLAYMGGMPGLLKDVLGVRSEEVDYLYPEEVKKIKAESDSPNFSGEYEVMHVCDVLRSEGATALATYTDDYYVGRPAVTKNRFGNGFAYYVGAASESESLLTDFYKDVEKDAGLKRILPNVDLPRGVSVQYREGDGKEFVFVSNYGLEDVEFDGMKGCVDILTGEVHQGLLKAGDVKVFERLI